MENLGTDHFLAGLPAHFIGALRAIEQDLDGRPRFGVVGGLVRDCAAAALAAGGASLPSLPASSTPVDLDIVVEGMAFPELLGALEARGFAVQVDGKVFPVARVTSLEGWDIQIALARRERSTGSARGDFEVETHGVSIEDDLWRRDLRINAMCVLLSGSFLDPCAGLGDLRARIIDTPLDPFVTLSEDASRALRCARFAARLGFELHPRLLGAMGDSFGWVSEMFAEAKFLELKKAAAEPGWSRFFALLQQAGLMAALLPEWWEVDGLDQANPHHFETASQHILSVCAAADAAGHRGLSIAMACLLHDIGKGRTKVVKPDGRGTFHGHEEVGAQMARVILERLRFPAAEVARVVRLVELHMRLRDDCGTSALRRLANALGEDLPLYVALVEADRAAHVGGLDARFKERLRALEAAAEALPCRAFCDHDLALSGSEIARLTGRQGRRIGEAKQVLVQMVIDGALPNDPASLEQALYTLP